MGRRGTRGTGATRVCTPQHTNLRSASVKRSSQARFRLPVILALLFSVNIVAAPVLAQDPGVAEGAAPAPADAARVVQDDPNNPIKFSIDPAIASGSVSTADLYIGTVGAY